MKHIYQCAKSFLTTSLLVTGMLFAGLTEAVGQYDIAEADVALSPLNVTSGTYNAGEANEVVVYSNASTGSKSSCNNNAEGKMTVLSLSSSDSHYLEVSATSGTIAYIQFRPAGNSTGSTPYTNHVFASTDATFDATSVTMQEFQWKGYDQACNDVQLALPAGTKSIRIYKRVKTNDNGDGTYSLGSGTNTGSGQTFNIFQLYVWVSGGSSTSPSLTVSPTSLSGLTKNIATGGATSTATFTLSGSNLTANAVVTAPEGFEISKNGTTGWATSLTYNHTGGTISDQTVYVRLSATTTGTKSGNITVTSTDATTRNVAVNGTVVDLTPLAAPTVGAPSDATSSSFTANWSSVTGAMGYVVHVYKSSTNLEVGTFDVPSSAATSAVVTGLDPLTSYYFKVEAKGNGSTSGNSALSAASSSISTTKNTDAMSLCLSEGFEELVPAGTDNSSNCVGASTPSVLIRYMSGSSTSRCDAALLGLSTGNWPATYIGAQGGDYTHGGSTRAVYLYRGGTLTTPPLVMPKKIEFYIRPKGSLSANATNKGYKVLVDGVVVTSGILVNDVELTTSTTTLPCITAGTGLFRLGSTSEWFKITVPLTVSNSTVTISSEGDSGADMYLDDIKVYCDPQELTISPEITGLNYVEDLGPSQTETIILTGSDLPVENGTATLTGPSNFQVSLDGGATWGTGTKTFPYTGGAFTQAVLVRLPAGITAGATGTRNLADVFTLNATGNQKTPPSINVKGKVTLYPVAVNCGETVDIINLKGTEATLVLTDASTGENWTTGGTGSVSHGTNTVNANAILMEAGALLTSPAISTSEYDLTTLSFDVQPSSGSAQNSIQVQLKGSNGYLINDAVAFTQKAVEHYSIDLSSMEATGSYILSLSPAKNSHYIWNVKVTGTAKRKFAFSPATLTGFQSYPDPSCPSEVQSFTIFGTCLDDNSSINLESASGNYEFSQNGTSGWSSAPSYSYTGEFPVSGMTVYVRQKSGLTPGSIQEDIKVTNNHKGFASFALSGEAASSSGWTPADGTVFNFQSAGGVADTVVIPIVGDKFCQAPTATTSCTGLTVSNCKDGSYAASTSFSTDYTDRNLYLRYVPGTLTNCAVNITAGGETHTIRINWNGAAAIANGVQPNRNAVTVPASGYGTVGVIKKGTLDDKTLVTITSDKFEFSMGNPEFGDFEAADTFPLGELQGTLYIRPKAGTTAGASESVSIATAGGNTATLNITVE